MKARPILMSAPMVRALLEDKKTQTRRVVKECHHEYRDHNGKPLAPVSIETLVEQPSVAHDLCPYGKPGDLLWVRETWRTEGKHTDSCSVEEISVNRSHFTVWRQADVAFNDDFLGKIRPSIYMPRWASRLTLELTDLRVERLKDISEDDAVAEGLSPERWYTHPTEGPIKDTGGMVARSRFKELWKSLNGPGSWDAKPWGWVLAFRVHQQNVDEFIKSREAA